MAVKLYSYFRSSASYRVRIALHTKKIPFDYIPVHLINNGGEQLKDNFKNLNPMAQVPTLVHEGKSLSQSMAIFHYLDSQWPEPKLFPLDPYSRAKVIEICEAFNSGIQPLHNLSVLNYLNTGMGLPEEAKKKWMFHWMKLGLEKVEHLLKSTAGTYCLGGELTAADMFLVPQVFACKRFDVDFTPYPTISRINKTCEALEAFKKAHPSIQPDA